MPRLNKQTAQKAHDSAADWNGRGFPLLDPGLYLAKLLHVEAKEGTQAPFWSWKYEEIESKTFLWDNTSLSEKAIGRLGKTFAAFGVPTNTDTDLMLGKVVALKVGVRTMNTGDRKGEQANTILDVLPPTEHPDYAGKHPTPAYYDEEF